MKGLIQYSAIATKIRAMQSHFITNEEFQTMANYKTVEEVANFLSTKEGYAKILEQEGNTNWHRNALERVISGATYCDFDSLYSFANNEQRGFLKIYARRFEIQLLKYVMTNIMADEKAELQLMRRQDFFNRHSQLDIALLDQVNTMEEFITALKDTDYYSILKRIYDGERHELFDYEFVLDLFHFRSIWSQKDRNLTATDAKLIGNAYGNKFDMLNLHWIYRSKKYFTMTDSEIYALLIPVRYKLKKEEIQGLVEAENMDEFQNIMKKTYYGKKYEQLSNDNIEEMYVSVLKHVLAKEARDNPYSAAVLYHYLYNKEHEINKLTIVIECVRYGVKPEITMSYIAKI